MVITAENRLQLEELMSEIRKALFGEEKLLQIPREDGSVMQ